MKALKAPAVPVRRRRRRTPRLQKKTKTKKQTATGSRPVEEPNKLGRAKPSSTGRPSIKERRQKPRDDETRYNPVQKKQQSTVLSAWWRLRVELLVALGAGEDDVDPDAHGLGAGRHQVVGALARLDAERQLGIGRTHRLQVVDVHLLDGLLSASRQTPNTHNTSMSDNRQNPVKPDKTR